ncbi:signal peptide peptidase SppA [Leptobacterium flavescens]|uniref:Signal peptide peptidase SppA n=1 Tax=Leptobacterium flavescens TaxID=472055 RepID=A0A6P0UH70_9FLAO|nr:signal peptide peptidase SppA [Leptobacterium flavescens]NER12594.1 signal peptide peptidase SppA [Leptobacterium flavescens]
MNFLKNILSTILGVLIAFGLLFFIFILFISLVGSSGEERVMVKNNSVLELNLNIPIVDFAPEPDPLEVALGLRENVLGLEDILNSISKAAGDDRIKGISIRNSFTFAGFGQTEAIRNALLEFKKSGKFVYAYSDFYLQKDYYLNSVADSIFLNPVGEMDFRGLSSEVMFYKDFQEKSGVKMEVIRHGKYKSAVEPYLENEMSEANREQISELLHSLWGEMLSDVSESRSLSVEDLNRIADTLGGRNPQYALKSGLIDAIAYKDEYDDALARALGEDDGDELETVKLTDYKSIASRAGSGTNRIAVIYAQGTIIYGKGDEFTIGQGVMIKAIKEAREDDKVKAIVLRVNSPGGSALTSELIWREIERTRKDKPVIVSMSNYAASGGYYIACNADRIIAEPTTITGSIGVFATIPNLKGLTDKLGINAEQVGTNEQSQGYSLFEPLSEDFEEFMQQGIEETYQTFLKRVADGRNMSIAEVDNIAQGRVWSGVDALKLGLVDELGGIDLALERAAEIAEIDNYKVENYPKIEKSLDDILNNLSGFPFAKSKQEIIEEEIGAEAYEIIKTIKKLSAQKGVQARLPFEITIK